MTLIVLGAQTMFASFFLAVLSLGRGSAASLQSSERKAQAIGTSELTEAQRP